MSNLVNKKKSKMSNILNNERFWSVLKIVSICACIIMSLTVIAYADANSDATKKIDDLAKMISGVFQKIAGVIIFIGAVQVAWAIKSESPDAKSQGLKTIAAGVLVVAVATGYQVFTK